MLVRLGHARQLTRNFDNWYGDYDGVTLPDGRQLKKGYRCPPPPAGRTKVRGVGCGQWRRLAGNVRTSHYMHITKLHSARRHPLGHVVLGREQTHCPLSLRFSSNRFALCCSRRTYQRRY